LKPYKIRYRRYFRKEQPICACIDEALLRIVEAMARFDADRHFTARSRTAGGRAAVAGFSVNEQTTQGVENKE
jgi:hypothetical protein